MGDYSRLPALAKQLVDQKVRVILAENERSLIAAKDTGDHHSDEWDDAPMPYSIFFTKIGHAVHGTSEQRNLGRPVSHGCIRLSVKNAVTLWELVKRQKMANTTVVLSVPGGAKPPAAARSRPMPLTADDASDSTPSPQSPTSESSR